MKKTVKIVGGVAVVACVILLFFAYHYRAEHYEIIQTVFLPTTNQAVLLQPGTICYSNKELTNVFKTFDGLDQAFAKPFDLDEPNLIACIMPNFTVEKIVGRDDFGLIILRKSSTNGVSFTVFRGTKRMLQFNYSDTN